MCIRDRLVPLHRSLDYTHATAAAPVRVLYSSILLSNRQKRPSRCGCSLRRDHSRVGNSSRASDACTVSTATSRSRSENGTRMSVEMTHLFLFLMRLLLLLESARPQSCPTPKIVRFAVVRPISRTPSFCAETGGGADVTQSSSTELVQCSRECADSDACIAFNYRQPQLVCELFRSPFSSLSLTPGCTHYEVSIDFRSVNLTNCAENACKQNKKMI